MSGLEALHSSIMPPLDGGEAAMRGGTPVAPPSVDAPVALPQVARFHAAVEDIAGERVASTPARLMQPLVDIAEQSALADRRLKEILLQLRREPDVDVMVLAQLHVESTKLSVITAGFEHACNKVVNTVETLIKS